MQRNKLHRIIFFCLGAVALICGAAWYVLSTLDSSNSAPVTMDEADLELQRIVSYGNNTPPTGDDPGSAYLDCMEVLGQECLSVIDEVEAVTANLRREDPFLDFAIKESDPSRLFQDSGEDRNIYVTAPLGTVVREVRSAFHDCQHLSTDTKAKYSAAIDEISVDYVLGRAPGEQNISALRELAKAHANHGVIGLLSFRAIEMEEDERFKIWQQLSRSEDPHPLPLLLQFEIARRFDLFAKQMSSMDLSRAKLAAWDKWFSCCKHYSDDPDVRRFLAEQLDELIASSNKYLREDMFKRAIDLNSDEFPEWMKHFFAYRMAKPLAAAHRGTEFINRVSSTDMSHFDRYSQDAANHLMKAWVLNPANPDLICSLLSHQNWSGTTPLSKFEWFCYAVAADPLNTRPYYNYANALQPKWGGSVEQQLEMAELCLDSGTAKSRVKLYSGYFITSVSDRAGQLRIDDGELNRLAVEFANHLSQLTAEEATKSVLWSHFPAIARILHDHEEFEALRKVLVTAPGALYPREFENRYLSLPLLQSYVSLDPTVANKQQQRQWIYLYKSLLLNAHTLEVDELAECKQQLNALRELNQGESQLAFQTFQQIAGILESFHQGEEVQLVYEGNEHLWVGRFLPVYAVDGGFGYEVPVNNHTGHLVSLIRFPVPFSLEATLTSHKNVADPFGAAMIVGPHQDIYLATGESNGAIVRFCREDRDVPADCYLLFDRMPENAFGMLGNNFLPFSMGDHMSLRCRLEVREERIDAFGGEKRLKDATILEKISVHGIVQFGRICNSDTNERKDDSIHSITDIKVKKFN